MGFEKNNNYGYQTKRGPGKKTVAKQAINKLHEIGIFPTQISNDLITDLLGNPDMNTDSKIKLLGISTNLMKFELVTEMERETLKLRRQELKLKKEQLNKDTKVIEAIQTKNKEDGSVIADSPADLLKQLKEQEK